MKVFIAALALAMMALRLTITGRPASAENAIWFMSIADIIAAYLSFIAWSYAGAPFSRKTEIIGAALASVAYFGGRVWSDPFYLTYPGAFEMASHIASGFIIFEMFNGVERLWSMACLVAAFSFEFAMFKINQANGFM